MLNIKPSWMKCIICVVATMLVLCSQLAMPMIASGQAAIKTPDIPVGKEGDVKFYGAKGGFVIGREALEQMPQADVVLWLAGNQFFAMDAVISCLPKRTPRCEHRTYHAAAGAFAASHKIRRLELRRQRVSRIAGRLCVRKSWPPYRAEKE